MVNIFKLNLIKPLFEWILEYLSNAILAYTILLGISTLLESKFLKRLISSMIIS